MTFALDLQRLLIQLLVILLATMCAGWLARRLGQPRVLGEMVAGIAVGPSLFGTLMPVWSAAVFPRDRLLPLATISQFGILLFMFVVGLRMDVGTFRARARTAAIVSNVSMLFPFALGTVLALWLYPTLAGVGVHGEPVALLPFALFLGAAMSVTAFPVLARILSESGLLHTEIGSVALASAAIDDVIAWCLLAGVVAVANKGSALGSFVGTIAGALLFTALLVLGGRRLLAWLDARRVTAGMDVTPELVGLAVLLAIASALITETLGVHALFGAFMAGTIMPRDSGLAHALATRMDTIVSALFLPIFFAYSGLRTEIGLLGTLALWGICLLVLVTAIVGKFGGAALAARLAGMSWRDAIGVGALMNTRGLMGLVVLNVGLEMEVISSSLFAIMVVMALVTTTMTSPLLRLVMRGAPVVSAVGSSPLHQPDVEPVA